MLLQSSLVLVFSRADLAYPHINLVSRVLVASQVFLLLEYLLALLALKDLRLVFSLLSMDLSQVTLQTVVILQFL